MNTATAAKARSSSQNNFSDSKIIGDTQHAADYTMYNSYLIQGHNRVKDFTEAFTTNPDSRP